MSPEQIEGQGGVGAFEEEVNRMLASWSERRANPARCSCASLCPRALCRGEPQSLRASGHQRDEMR